MRNRLAPSRRRVTRPLPLLAVLRFVVSGFFRYSAVMPVTCGHGLIQAVQTPLDAPPCCATQAGLFSLGKKAASTPRPRDYRAPFHPCRIKKIEGRARSRPPV